LVVFGPGGSLANSRPPYFPAGCPDLDDYRVAAAARMFYAALLRISVPPNLAVSCREDRVRSIATTDYDWPLTGSGSEQKDNSNGQCCQCRWLSAAIAMCSTAL
jgi:hypothetical protein